MCMIKESTCFWKRGNRRYIASFVMINKKWPINKEIIRVRTIGRCVEECKAIAESKNKNYKLSRLVSVKFNRGKYENSKGHKWG